MNLLIFYVSLSIIFLNVLHFALAVLAKDVQNEAKASRMC